MTDIKTSSKSGNSKSKKKKFKLPHVFTLLFAIVVICMFITWMAPSGYYVDTTYFSAGIKPQGIVQALMAFGNGFIDAAALVFFLFGLGALINVVMKSEAMEAAIGSTLKKLDHKELYLIPILMIFFGLGGSIYGMNEETLAFYAILVPIFVLAGFDAMTGFFVIMLGAGAGVLASTVNPFSIGAAVDATGMANINTGQGMAFRWTAFIIIMAIAISFVMWYALRVKKNKEHSAFSEEERKDHEKWAKENYNLDELPTFNWRRIATLSIFFGFLAWMIFVFIPWEELGIPIFASAAATITENFPYLDNSGAWTIGTWYFLEVGILAFFLAVIVALINKNKEAEVYDNMVDGGKDMLGVALVISLARGVSIILGGQAGAVTIEQSTSITDTFNLIAADGSGKIIATYDVANPGWTTPTSNIEFEQWLDNNTRALQDAGGDWFVEFKQTDGSFTTSYNVTISLTNSLLNSMSGISSLSEYAFTPVIYIVYIPISFLIPSTSGAAGATFGIIGPLAGNVGPDPVSSGGVGMVPQAITGFSYASGLVNLITPTSGVVMGALVITKIEYGKYLKAVWKCILILFAASVLLMVLAATSFGSL